MSRRTVSSFWNEHASATRPGNCSSAYPTTRSAVQVSTSDGSWSVCATEQHLLHRVAAESEAQRLERDDLVGRDVAEVHARAEALNEPALRGLGRRLKDDVRRTDRERDLADQFRSHPAARVEDPGRPALACLGDDLPCARGEILVQPRDPLVSAVLDGRVLRADLGENGEVAREVGDELQLAVARDVDRPVGDLDVRETKP